MKTVQKRVAAMERQNKQSVRLRAVPDSLRFSVEGNDKPMADRFRYFSLPISQAIPPQNPGVGVPSAQFRKGRTVTVKSVKVRFTVVHRHGVKVSGVVHQGNHSPLPRMECGPDGVPQCFHLGHKESAAPRMLSLEETGFLSSRGGPYEVEARQSAMGDTLLNTPALCSVDGSIFDCAIVKGDGAPIGKVEYYSGTKGEAGCVVKHGRTANLKIAKPAGEDVEQTLVTLYWELNKQVTFEHKEDATIIGNHLQMMLMVCSTAGQLGGGGKEDLESGAVRDFMLQVYYE
jgi:hypothetical protein